jgi:hypothetical protein
MLADRVLGAVVLGFHDVAEEREPTALLVDVLADLQSHQG